MCSWNVHNAEGPHSGSAFVRHRRGWWFILGFPFVLIFLALGSLVVMLLWNALLPAIFGLKAISFLQAAGLLVLSKILFGGFRHRPRPFYGPNRHWAQWKNWHGEHPESSPRERPSADESSKE